MTIIAFDVDGTLRKAGLGPPVADERIRTLLVTLASFRGVRIHVWSGSGELYARQMARELGVAPHVHSYSAKDPALFTPDIAVDDVADCRLGHFNLIIGE